MCKNRSTILRISKVYPSCNTSCVFRPVQLGHSWSGVFKSFLPDFIHGSKIMEKLGEEKWKLLITGPYIRVTNSRIQSAYDQIV